MSLEPPHTPSTTLPIIKTSAASDPSPDDAEVSVSAIPRGYFDLKPPAHSSATLTRTNTYPPPSPGHLQTPPIPDSPWEANPSPKIEDSPTIAIRRRREHHSPRSGQSWTPCLSPGSHSSCLSSGISSGDYLTPPPEQADCDLPPYRPSRRLSDSLTMKHPGHSEGDSSTKPRRPRKRHRHRMKRERHYPSASEIAFYAHPNRPYWWLPGCYTSPTAPAEYQRLCEANMRSNLAYQMINIRGSLRPPFTLGVPPAPMVKRRWSSIEIGSHQLLSSRPRSTTEKILDSTRRRGTTISSVASDYEVVKSIKQTLTSRKLPWMKNPATITLRRPSDALKVHRDGSDSTSETPLGLRARTETPATDFAPTYLITSQDVKDITALVDAALRGNKARPKTPPVSQAPGPASNLLAPMQVSCERRPSITSRGLLPSIIAPADAAVTAERVESNIFGAWKYNVGQHSSLARRQLSSISRARSDKSTHEVIWDDKDNSLRHSSSSQSPDHLEDNHGDESSPQETPFLSPCLSAQSSDHHSSDSNRVASIEKWAWGVNTPGKTPLCTPLTPPFAFGTSDYFAADTKLPKSLTHKTRKTDVVSFPPLQPRKLTSDWISPLPDISKPLPAPPTLSDEGIDATYAPSSPHVPFKGSPQTEVRSKHGEGSNSSQQVRRRSIIQPHPLAPARAGGAFTVGSALGSSSGTRKKSSVPRIRIMDNSRVERSNPSTWRKARTDSAYPLITSPLAGDDESGRRTSAFYEIPAADPASRVLAAPRAQILDEKTPPLGGKVDRVGIYNEITGADSMNRPSLRAASKKHDCDDCADYPDRMPSVDWIG